MCIRDRSNDRGAQRRDRFEYVARCAGPRRRRRVDGRRFRRHEGRTQRRARSGQSGSAPSKEVAVRILRAVLFTAALLLTFSATQAAPLDRPNALDRRVDALSPVSYTHLDVYKRQG